MKTSQVELGVQYHAQYAENPQASGTPFKVEGEGICSPLNFPVNKSRTSRDWTPTLVMQNPKAYMPLRITNIQSIHFQHLAEEGFHFELSEGKVFMVFSKGRVICSS